MAVSNDMRSEEPRASVLSIASIVASMACVGIGNGMMFAYVPFLLAKGDSPPWVAGAAVTALAFGGLAGCVVAGPVIRRVGHARAFSCSMALVLLSAFLIALGFHPLLWVFARGVYGAAGNINFIISLSWAQPCQCQQLARQGHVGVLHGLCHRHRSWRLAVRPDPGRRQSGAAADDFLHHHGHPCRSA